MNSDIVSGQTVSVIYLEVFNLAFHLLSSSRLNVVVPNCGFSPIIQTLKSPLEIDVI